MNQDIDGIETGPYKSPLTILYDPEEFKIDEILREFARFLNRNRAVFLNDTMLLDSFKVFVNNRISIQSREHIVIQSGRNKNKDGHINSVHINPDLDQNNNPIRPHIPFKYLRARPVTKRPKNKNHISGCRCCS